MPEQRSRLNSNTTQKMLLLTVVTLFWFSQYVFMPYQTPYLYGTGAASSLVGIVIGAYGFSQLVLRIPVGLMVDSTGRYKRFILLGLASSGCASLFRIFIPDTYGFLLANLFSGLAAAMWISFMVLFFTYFGNEELQKATGLIVGANNLGILIGFVTGTVLYDRFGIRFLCLLSSLAAVPAFLLGLLIHEPERSFHGQSPKELVQVFHSKRLILFALIAFVQQGIQISTSMSFTSQIAKSRGANGAQIGICSIIYILVAVLSSYFISTKAARKFGSSFWIPAVLACLALYCVLIPNLPTVELIDFAQILSGLSTGILFSLCTSEAMKSVPQEKHSTAMGFFQAIYALGMTTFPILAGAISGRSGISSAFYCLAAIAVSGFLVMVIYYRFNSAKE